MGTGTEARGKASARAALAGNPSDAYGGAVLAVTMDALVAEATAVCAPAPEIEPPSRLVEATVRRFARELVPGARATAVRWRTEIPRGVGLGGSSAIVISTVRALCGLYGMSLEPAELASFALSVETEELGIAAGPQDRVAQAYGGLTFMDFGAPHRHERLDPTQLPPLVIAWLGGTAQDSQVVHSSLRSRFEHRDGDVTEAMRELAGLARAARAALLAGDHLGFRQAVDETFDVRQRLIALEPRHVELVQRTRTLGASANYTGSGGAIVAVCREPGHAEEVRRALSEIGCGTLAGSGAGPQLTDQPPWLHDAWPPP